MSLEEKRVLLSRVSLRQRGDVSEWLLGMLRGEAALEVSIVTELQRA